MTDFKKDFLFALKIALGSMIAVSLLLVLGGFLFTGFSIREAVGVWRSGMCIVSGLTLFLVGGTILFKRKFVPEDDSHWRARFKVLSYGDVMGIIAVIFIVGTVVADYFALKLQL